MIGDPDYTQDLAPAITLAMQAVCPFTITMVASKTPLPDTSANVIAFGPVVDVVFANIADAKIIYNCSI